MDHTLTVVLNQPLQLVTIAMATLLSHHWINCVCLRLHLCFVHFHRKETFFFLYTLHFLLYVIKFLILTAFM